MPTKELVRASQPEDRANDIAHKALTMALGILVERIQRLPPEDRDELFQLVKELPNTKTCEEGESIVIAMQEILEQAPVQVSAVDMTSAPSEGLQKWVGYVSDKIRVLRKEKGLSQEELSQRSGLPQSHISRLERGEHSPSRATLSKIAVALGVELKLLDPSAE